MYHSVDAGDYSGACRLHLNSLICSESRDGDYGRMCSSSTIVKASAYEAPSPEDMAYQQNDVEVEQTSDSGYDSAQSYQPVQHRWVCPTSSQSREPHEAQNCDVLMSLADQQSNSADVLSSELDDCGICNVRERITGSDCDTVAQKLHAPVDFYARFKCPVSGLHDHVVS